MQSVTKNNYNLLRPLVTIELGDAWAANSINTVVFRYHGVITTECMHQFTSFFIDESTIHLIKRNIASNHLTENEIKGDYNVFDAHNSISIGIDPTKLLHLSYDQHAEKLNYRRSEQPLSIDSWTCEIFMTGNYEEKVTYPAFINITGSKVEECLLLLYRNGKSSNGDAHIKKYNEGKQEWEDQGKPILKGTEQKPWTCGPYWTNPVVDSSGRIHLFLTWRTHSLGEKKRINNVNIDYAYSVDRGETWYTSRKLEYQLPITPVNSETVYPISPGSNLINQTSAAVDNSNNPHMIFYSDDPDGIPQYQHLWFDGREWKHSYISNRNEPFALEGGGALQIPISRPEVLIDRNDYVYVIFRGDITERRMAVQRLSPPDYNPPGQFRILWDEPVDFAEPVIDRVRWGIDGILTMLIQKNYQPPHDLKHEVRMEPIYLVDWDITKGW